MTCTQCGTLNEETAKECKRCKRPLTSLLTQGKIPCYIHTNREATSTCAASGVRICNQCIVNYNGLDYAVEFAPDEVQRAMPQRAAGYEAIPVLEGTNAEVASFGRRLGAWVIDAAVIVGATLFVYVVIQLFTGFGTAYILYEEREEPVGYWLLRIFAVVGTLGYVAFMTALDGQTLGKRATGIMVLRPDGHPIDLQMSLIRAAVAVVSLLALGIGFLWAIWDKDHQTWHDKVAGTSVFNWSEHL